jgi:hypothetical protein
MHLPATGLLHWKLNPMSKTFEQQHRRASSLWEESIVKTGNKERNIQISTFRRWKVFSWSSHSPYYGTWADKREIRFEAENEPKPRCPGPLSVFQNLRLRQRDAIVSKTFAPGMELTLRWNASHVYHCSGSQGELTAPTQEE